MDLIKAIKKRKSTRKYKETKIDDKKIKNIIEKSIETDKLFESDIVVDLRDRKEINDLIKGIIGDYGKIISPHYFILSTEKEKKNIIDLGFLGEQLILELTKEKLATCWIGKFGSKEKIGNRLNLKNQKKPQALLAFGKPSKKGFRNEEPNRKKLNELIIGGKRKIKFDQILELVKLAPSALNRQPWRFKLKDNRIDFYLSKKGLMEKFLRNISNLKLLNYIDIGIALKHAQIGGEKYIEGETKFEELCGDNISGLEYIISLIVKE